jgi:hypothetical protein
MEGRALQDILKTHCFGCGSLNERGLWIKSHWDGVSEGRLFDAAE